MSQDKPNKSSSLAAVEISRRRLLRSASLIAASAAVPVALPEAVNAATGDGSVLPRPRPPFQGKMERLLKDSTPDFPKVYEAPPGSPNVLLILTDDVGFGASSTFGGPIQTPNFQRLADTGLRYNMYHTTALCSPTRAALITGRNHHSVASGVITEFATGYPGYNSIVPKAAGSVGEVLKENGYNTSWFGKMHNVPDWMSSQAGPFDLWPNGLGFEHFYGFLGGDSDQWHPALYDNTNPIEPYLGNPDYILDRDLADKAIAWMRMQHALAPQKPWLLYYATGTAHAPHHAPKDWIAKYKGQFDQGWDKVREETLARQIKQGVVPPNTQLTKRPEQIPAWDSLSDDQKRLYARMMEVYAGALSHADYNIGRLLDALEESGQRDNTLIVFMMGDNGASAEGTLQGTTNEVGTAANGVTESIPFLLSMIDELGGPKTYNHYPVGWAHAMDAPMQWTKQNRVPFRRHAERHGHLLAGAYQGQGRLAVPVLPRHRHRADHLRGGQHHAARDAGRRKANAHRGREPCLHIRRRQSSDPASGSIFRDDGESRHLQGRLDCKHDAPPSALGNDRIRAEP
jgi:arylsulfatase